MRRSSSPIQLYENPEFEALQELASGAISKRFAAHYRGFFKGMCREHGLGEVPRAKTLLYAYRVVLTGVHLMTTGELVGDVGVTAPLYGFDEVTELAAFKQAESETVQLSATDDGRYRARWPDLEAALAAALEGSSLSEEPTNAQDCDAWLVELRRGEL